MKYYLRSLKLMIIKCCWPSLLSLFSKVDFMLQEAQKHSLINRFKFCGKNCFLQMPIHIDGAENIEVGDDVSIAAFVHMWGQGGIKIGSRVMIASHCAVTTLTHDYNQEQMYKTMISKQVVIKDDVWIGPHSIILPGVTIAEGAVVGAGSVVTQDVKPNSIVTGVPAKHYRFRPTRDTRS